MTSSDYEPSPWRPIADHVDRYIATNGEDGFDFEGAQCVILTTTGRKSGAIRRSPIVRVKDGDRYLAVASMGGGAQAPELVPQPGGQFGGDDPGSG